MAQNEMAQKSKAIADALMDPKYANSDMRTVLELAAMQGMLFVMEQELAQRVAMLPPEPNDMRQFIPQSAGC